MDPETPVEIVRKDEEIASVGIKRNRKGLIITVLTHSAVEGLFQDWGTGERQSIKVHGHHWKPLRDSSPLFVWQMGRTIQPMQTPSGVWFNLDKPGGELITVDPNGRTSLNLSFLRLCESSQGTHGVSFVCSGVYSTDVVDQLAKYIPSAIERFHATYLMPVDCRVRVFSEVEHL